MRREKTVMILSFQSDRSGQTVQTQIRLESTLFAQTLLIMMVSNKLSFEQCDALIAWNLKCYDKRDILCHYPLFPNTPPQGGHLFSCLVRLLVSHNF